MGIVNAGGVVEVGRADGFGSCRLRVNMAGADQQGLETREIAWDVFGSGDWRHACAPSNVASRIFCRNDSCVHFQHSPCGNAIYGSETWTEEEFQTYPVLDWS